MSDAAARPAPRATVRSLEQLEMLLPRITNDELLEFIIRGFEEGARRAENYAGLTAEDDPPVDAINEGLAFAVRLDDYLTPFLPTGRARTAHNSLDDALNDLKEFGQARLLAAVKAERGEQ